MRLCLVEDSAVVGLEPLTLTRPVFDLMLGGCTLGGKIARAFRVGAGAGSGSPRRGAVIRPYLSGIRRQRDPHTAVNDRDWLAQGPVIVANGRWLPPEGFEPPEVKGSWVGLCDGLPAFAMVGPGEAVGLEPNGADDWFEDVSTRLACREVGGAWISRPWDLVARNAEQVARDFR